MRLIDGGQQFEIGSGSADADDSTAAADYGTVDRGK
jgi:hypothetical protein